MISLSKKILRLEKSSDFFHLYIIISFLVIIPFFPFLILYSKIIITENVLFWTLSTLAQSLTALLAFIGMLGIFKLQILNQELERISEKARKIVVYFKGPLAESYTQKKLINECNKISEKKHRGSKSEVNQIRLLSHKMNEKAEQDEKIKKYLLGLSANIIFLVFYSLFFLSLVPEIYKSGMGLALSTGIIILSFPSFILSMLLMLRIFKT